MLAALIMSSMLFQVPAQADVKRHLETEIVGRWIPLAVDRKGGFHQNFDSAWKPLPDDSRGVVYQARLTWLASIGGKNEVAEHGVRYLMDHMWDKGNGGFWWSVGLDGKPSAEKHTYGNAFALYALSRRAKGLADANSSLVWDAWANAENVFDWLDEHVYDRKSGGWFETVSEFNKPILSGSGSDSIGTPFGVRSMNTTIHILEALLEYVQINRRLLRSVMHSRQESRAKLGSQKPNPDYAKVHDAEARLREAYRLVREKFVTKGGELHYYLASDYSSARSDIDSYGHELETAYLLLEAAEVLGKPDDKETWRKAKLLMDHCLKVAWDEQNGGFFYEGHIGEGPSERKKEWWTTAEGLNALRIFCEEVRGDLSDSVRAALEVCVGAAGR